MAVSECVFSISTFATRTRGYTNRPTYCRTTRQTTSARRRRSLITVLKRRRSYTLSLHRQPSARHAEAQLIPLNKLRTERTRRSAARSRRRQRWATAVAGYSRRRLWFRVRRRSTRSRYFAPAHAVGSPRSRIAQSSETNLVTTRAATVCADIPMVAEQAARGLPVASTRAALVPRPARRVASSNRLNLRRSFTFHLDPCPGGVPAGCCLHTRSCQRLFTAGRNCSCRCLHSRRHFFGRRHVLLRYSTVTVSAADTAHHPAPHR
jgi:hypothetical protein